MYRASGFVGHHGDRATERANTKVRTDGRVAVDERSATGGLGADTVVLPAVRGPSRLGPFGNNESDDRDMKAKGEVPVSDNSLSAPVAGLGDYDVRPDEANSVPRRDRDGENRVRGGSADVFIGPRTKSSSNMVMGSPLLVEA